MSRGLRAQLLRRLARRYQAGATLDELAPLVGCSVPTLAARFRELGVTIRPPGRRRGHIGNRRGHIGNNASAIARLAAEGLGQADIARKLGISRQAVAQSLKRHPQRARSADTKANDR